ncbi:MAG: thioredoxin-dependent thiol peroxidase [Cytophagales bacterium]|nr:thioredoxin-dependent thiol peroxidase [Cytophaga sp.]
MNVYSQTALKVGDKAPDFSGLNQDGKSISLSSYKDKKVVLFFYPKDNTPGCTAEACNLRDNNKDLIKAGYTVIGISTDDVASHKGFASEHSLPFPLIADTDQSINKKYGVWKEKERVGKKYFGTSRTTFVIDKGVITKIITDVSTSDHAAQILK